VVISPRGFSFLASSLLFGLAVERFTIALKFEAASAEVRVLKRGVGQSFDEADNLDIWQLDDLKGELESLAISDDDAPLAKGASAEIVPLERLTK
jgi:hypothetical protein